MRVAPGQAVTFTVVSPKLSMCTTDLSNRPRSDYTFQQYEYIKGLLEKSSLPYTGGTYEE